MKKIISIMLSLCLAVTTLAAVLPSSAAAKTQVTPNLINTGDVEIDTDGSDGYSGRLCRYLQPEHKLLRRYVHG